MLLNIQDSDYNCFTIASSIRLVCRSIKPVSTGHEAKVSTTMKHVEVHRCTCC